MGGFVEYLGFLMTLFPECFMSQLPPGTWFDLCIVDLMMWAAGQTMNERAHQPHFNAGLVVGRIERAVIELQNNEDDPSRPLLRTGLVCLLDTVHQVPRSKGATQRARDTSGEPHMTEARYNEMRALYPEAQEELFLGSIHQTNRYPLRGSEVWRSQNLKLQLYRLISCHVLSQHVRQDRVLLLDDGLVCTPEDWADWHACIVAQHHYEARSRFEQEVLVATELQQNALRRYMVWGDGQHREWEPTGSGEADIKVLHYLQPGVGARRFLVANQDKDLIFVLLLQMERLLAAETGDEAEPLAVWLDTHSPGNKGAPKPYRYIDIVALYRGLRALFAQEYPQVRHPVETFCFLAFMRKTDFVQPLCEDCPEKRGHVDCLCISDADAWNLFSELHSTAAEYVRFAKDAQAQVPRSRERHWSQALHGLLAHGVSYDHVARHFLFQHSALKRFYYMLFQQRVMRLRAQMRLPVPLADSPFEAVRATALDEQELLIYAHDVAERLEAYRQWQARDERKMVQTLLSFSGKRVADDALQPAPTEKKFKQSSARGKLLRASGPLEPVEQAVVPEPEEEIWKAVPRGSASNAEPKMAQYVQQNADRLRPLSRFAFKQYHGVPSPERLLLRLYDLELYMNYMRDGWWKGAAAADELTQRARLDDSLQVWPYEERALQREEERARALNSTHYVQRPLDGGGYALLEVLKSEHVIHRRYTEFVQLHV